MVTEDESIWINEVAGRLRLIQADAATAAPDKRREFLHEEIARNLKTVVAGNRKRYLEALLRRFPVGGDLVKAAGTPAPAAPVAAAQPRTDTPEEIIERFFDVVSKLPEPARAELSKRLAEAGFNWVDRNELVLEVSNELRQKLGLPEGQQPRLARVVELAVLLVDMLARLDQTALNALRELSQRSKLLRRPEDFRTATARFLTSDDQSLDPYVRAVSSLLGSMLAALLTAGRDFGRQYHERLSPDVIMEVVKSDREYSSVVVGKSKEHCCWEKYKLLAEDFATPDLIDRRIKDCMAAVVEKPGR